MRGFGGGSAIVVQNVNPVLDLHSGRGEVANCPNGRFLIHSTFWIIGPTDDKNPRMVAVKKLNKTVQCLEVAVVLG